MWKYLTFKNTVQTRFCTYLFTVSELIVFVIFCLTITNSKLLVNVLLYLKFGYATVQRQQVDHHLCEFFTDLMI